jgi:hypothetical protein
MQNKPNLPDAQMNVTAVNTMNNELRTMNYFMQNKPNQTQSRNNYKARCCGLTVSFDSAKMALYTGNLEFEKRQQKNYKWLQFNRLSGSTPPDPSTGTIFAPLNLDGLYILTTGK